MGREKNFQLIGSGCHTPRVELQVWLALLGAVIAIAISPGPGAILSMATGLTHGVRRSYWTITGLETGLMVQLTLVAVGLGAALSKSVLAFTVIKWLCVAYLVYLAVRQWRTAAINLDTQLDRGGDPRRVAMYTRGLLVNITNPKGLVFLLAVVPQFVDPAAPLVQQYLVIGVTMVVVDLIVMGCYAGLASRLIRVLSSARQQKLLNRTFSGLFAAAAVGLSLMRRAATV